MLGGERGGSAPGRGYPTLLILALCLRGASGFVPPLRVRRDAAGWRSCDGLRAVGAVAQVEGSEAGALSFNLAAMGDSQVLAFGDLLVPPDVCTEPATLSSASLCGAAGRVAGKSHHESGEVCSLGLGRWHGQDSSLGCTDSVPAQDESRPPFGGEGVGAAQAHGLMANC
jgi:hypothetical protein